MTCVRWLKPDAVGVHANPVSRASASTVAASAARKSQFGRATACRRWKSRIEAGVSNGTLKPTVIVRNAFGPSARCASPTARSSTRVVTGQTWKHAV